jgi:hypothetical protein
LPVSLFLTMWAFWTRGEPQPPKTRMPAEDALFAPV